MITYDHIINDMANCMGCPKFTELKSLRIQVSHFVSGKVFEKLNTTIEKANRKIESISNDNDCLKAENNRLRSDNRFLKEENIALNQRYDILVEKHIRLQKIIEETDVYQTEEFKSKIDSLFLTVLNENESLKERLSTLNFENQRMKAILNNDGTNSGTPTSKTPLNKDKVRPNSRVKSDSPRGGVKGHRKSKLPGFSDDELNEHKEHPYEGNCPKCNGTMEDTGKTIDKDETDFEIKTVKRRHHFKIYRCPCCGKEVHKPIPKNLKEENQYGTGVQAAALSLMNSCNVPINKTGEFLEGVTNGQVHPSDGYLAKLQKRNAEALRQFMLDLKNVLIVRAILYWDDTVIMIDKERGCLRFYGDEHIAYYVAHLHKDLDGIMQDQILQNLSKETKVMHDHNTVNYNQVFIFQNLECNAHLIRDLQKVEQILEHSWASDLHKLISETIHERKEALKVGLKNFGEAKIRQFFDEVTGLIKIGRGQCRKDRRNYYGNEEFALLNRIEKYMENYFLWVKDFSLPTTDSLSERALRGVKSKMKISGQFYSEQTANNYAVIKSYIETCRRNGINEMQALQRLADGNPYTVQEILHLDNQ